MDVQKDLRSKLYALCEDYVNQRIETAQQALDDAQQSANTEDKSSAGDKYETGRAMAHLEREKAAEQLQEARKLKAELLRVSQVTGNDRISLGNIVITSIGNFYLSVSAGKLISAGVEFVALSPVSPLGASLINRKEGDQVVFNKKDILIEKIH